LHAKSAHWLFAPYLAVEYAIDHPRGSERLGSSQAKRVGVGRAGAQGPVCDQDDVVEAFPSDCTDQSLRVRILPWRSRSYGLVADPHRSQSAWDHRAVDPVPIPDQIVWDRPRSPPDQANVMRQAIAGMLWSKQFFFFDGDNWLDEHHSNPLHAGHRNARNSEWFHMLNEDIISMPDALDMAGAAGFETLHSECPSAFAEVLARFKPAA
jgi:hypothetical protein